MLCHAIRAISNAQVPVINHTFPSAVEMSRAQSTKAEARAKSFIRA